MKKYSKCSDEPIYVLKLDNLTDKDYQELLDFVFDSSIKIKV